MTEAGVPQRPLRVLLIGAGRRIQNNYLPALAAMPDQFTVVGVHARTEERLGTVAERWSVPTSTSLDRFDLSAVDVIAASVPTSANAPVLQSLHDRLNAAERARMRLVIDTPISWNKQELIAVTPLLKGFGQIAAAEDYMNYPPFALIRAAVADGLIGRPRVLTLNNTGFLFHGLALIRSFVGFEPVFRTSRVTFGTLGAAVRYRFRSGFEAHVIGPYRAHSTGGLVLEGESGLITEFAQDCKQDDGKNRHLLTYRRQDGILSACVLTGRGEERVLDMPAIAMMQAMPFADKSDLNLLRGCGLMTVFRSLLDPGDMNNSYGPYAAMYDGFVSQRATRGQFPLDPFVMVGSNAVAAFSQFKARSKPAPQAS
jgi:hypothetical protein